MALENSKVFVANIQNCLDQQASKLHLLQSKLKQLQNCDRTPSNHHQFKPETPYFIITRFAIGIYDKQWLAYRFLLFEAITLPSILSQSNQNFTWFIVSDRNLPSQYKQRLRDLASTYQNIENLEVDFYCQYREIVETGIKARIKNHQQAIAISHIDDDDAWHITTIQQYRQRIKRKQYRQLLKAFQR